MKKIQFNSTNMNSEVFSIKHPEHMSYLYFPIASEQGIKGNVTPELGGDIKLDQNTFIMEPVSAENLHNNRSTRNFWCKIEGGKAWSATGASATSFANRFTDTEDETTLEAGFMWHKMQRVSKENGLEAVVTTFAPANANVELTQVVIKNTNDTSVTITSVAAVPIYGRSADNIRDHRHVTSLLHQIETLECGVTVTPKLSFDERGHKKNDISYFVYGVTGSGKNPECFYPVVEEYLGDGGNFTNPEAIRVANPTSYKAGNKIDGKEALGGIQFEKVTLASGEETSYTIIIGAAPKAQCDSERAELVKRFDSEAKVNKALEEVKTYWTEKVNVSFHTGDENFDSYMRWVCFQPMLRRIYGCSFLPYHDYGKGGRGWRDLWQDCLSLLIMNPDGVRQMIVDNFGGVRIDGTNATIIGSKQGEFIADRNNITRVWMDHGFWPFVTTKLYIDQTGDINIFDEKVPYFKDAQAVRGTKKDTLWDEAYGKCQKDEAGKVYEGTILEHVLLQLLSAFYEVGEHNEIRLRGADWNDALDMADKRGESVAFTCAYAGNMKDFANYLAIFGMRTGKTSVKLPKEMISLISCPTSKYDDIEWKNQVLIDYSTQCIHNLSGEMEEVKIIDLVTDLNNKADWMMDNIRKNEWVGDNENNGWYNGYYDNSGRAVEGVVNDDVRMMLTGQVFAIMSGTATPDQITSICKSADKYLYEKSIGGYRLNTKFSEDKFDLGRMFGFAYGEKENGAVFSHMTVMYSYALYKQGFVKEGYKALQTLIDASMNFESSKIYPGVPEYFDAKGRGMYHYLTGAASWYMLTLLTQAFGIRGELGNLTLDPKLTLEQFDSENKASVELPYMGKWFKIIYNNVDKAECGQYYIDAVKCDKNLNAHMDGSKAVIDKEEILKLSDELCTVEVTLKKSVCD